MAKTLIGNIKGKNGRGITSIKKTGTDGSVDTYTIAYTDSTTSTFTINNPDSISLQRQIVPSAAVESSATASQAYAAGDYVVVNGVLRKVTAAIAKGNAISDSNSTATTVTGELAAIIGNSVSQMALLLSEDLTVPGGKMHVDVYDVPAIRELVMRVSGNISSTGKFFADYYTTGKIPKDKLPSMSVNCALAQYEGTWGRFCARGCILDDGRARLSLISPQAIQTGYTSECHISYAF